MVADVFKAASGCASSTTRVAQSTAESDSPATNTKSGTLQVLRGIDVGVSLMSLGERAALARIQRHALL